MRTIRIYGDSFAFAATFNNIKMGWGKMLGDLLSLPVHNSAVSGGSTEYAIKSFINDIENNLIGDDDIIIYVPSSPGRLYFSYQLNVAPNTAGPYTHKTFYFNPTESREWYWENKSHIEWWMVNNDRDMQIITFESYIQLLKNFAISKPNCTVIVLPAFHSSKYNQDIFNNLPPHNFLRANINLSTVSQIEIDDTTEYDYFKWTKFTKVDSRVNHLTQINLTILANLLVESIKTLNIDNITYDKFQTNIIKTITSKEEYLKYVENNILPYRKDIDQIIS